MMAAPAPPARPGGPLARYGRDVTAALSWRRRYPAKCSERLRDAHRDALAALRRRRGEAALLRHARRVLYAFDHHRDAVERATLDPELEL